MTNVSEKTESKESRSFVVLPGRSLAQWPAIIRAVQTPLGLAALVILAIASGGFGYLASGQGQPQERLVAVLCLFGLMTAVELVILFKLNKSSFLKPKRISRSELKVLAVCTKEFSTLGFDEDLKSIKQLVREDRIIQEPSITRSRFLEVFSVENGPFDIVHIVGKVDAGTGNFIFSEGLSGESLDAERFAGHIEAVKAKIVIFATCESVRLAVRIAEIANVIGGIYRIPVEDFSVWNRNFYNALAKGESLAKSFALANELVERQFAMIVTQDYVII